MTETTAIPESEQAWLLTPLDEALWRPTVPLVVMLAVRDTKRPRLLSAWLGLRWLVALNPNVAGWSGREIAHAALISEDGIGDDLRELYKRNLIAKPPSPSQGRYTIDTALLARLERESIIAYPTLIARYADTD